MAKLTLIKDLRTGSTTLLRLLGTFVFGDKTVAPYDPNQTYNYGDLVIDIDSTTGRIRTLQCQDNNVTGTYNVEKWESVAIGDTATQGAAKIFTMDLREPTDKGNLFWFRPLKYQQVQLPGSDTITDIKITDGVNLHLLNRTFVGGEELYVNPIFNLKKVADAKP